ncbi:hypothetical protein MRX96_055802 [Rhipicephalus microplus]
MSKKKKKTKTASGGGRRNILAAAAGGKNLRAKTRRGEKPSSSRAEGGEGGVGRRAPVPKKGARPAECQGHETFLPGRLGGNCGRGAAAEESVLLAHVARVPEIEACSAEAAADDCGERQKGPCRREHCEADEGVSAKKE